MGLWQPHPPLSGQGAPAKPGGGGQVAGGFQAPGWGSCTGFWKSGVATDQSEGLNQER